MGKVIFEDTRNQIGKHKLLNLELSNIYGYEIIRTKLDCGDYQLPKSEVTIDTKMSVMELLGDVTKDHQRFKRELQLAQKVEKKMYILVEEGNFWNLDNINEWKSPIRKYGKMRGKPYSQMDMSVAQKMLKTISIKYNCTFLFCDKKDTARIIIKLLEGDIK